MSDELKKLAAYMAKQPEEKRAGLEQMRAMIYAAQPDLEDGFSYGVPAVRYKGELALLYAAFKGHYGLYPYDERVVEQLIEDLEGYDIAKGTIRFALDQPLPKELIGKVVRAKLAIMEQDIKKSGE